ARQCPACKGGRLRPESLAVTVGGLNIMELTRLSVREALAFFSRLESELTERERTIAHQVLKEIRARLGFLLDVGLDYLTLDRPGGTLSAGGARRLRRAARPGAELVGVPYILDAPSIGLPRRDNARLPTTRTGLRDRGNALIVAGHAEDTIRAAAYLVDI